jgi:hypothetical protein
MSVGVNDRVQTMGAICQRRQCTLVYAASGKQLQMIDFNPLRQAT